MNIFYVFKNIIILVYNDPIKSQERIQYQKQQSLSKKAYLDSTS